MAIAKLDSSSSPEEWGDGSLPRQGLKPTRTLSSEFRSVNCTKLEQEKWGFSGGVVCQNEKIITNADVIRNDRMLCKELARRIKNNDE